jgi:peptide/nickel transport system substrate-binding protein
MKGHKLYLLGAFVLVLSMILGACAPAATPAPAEVEAPAATEAPAAPAEPVATEAPAAPAEPATTEAPAMEEPAPSKVSFIFGRGGDSVQLDPAIVTDGESFRVTGQIYNRLYKFEKGGATPIPDLAEECTPNMEGTEWTCTLRQGVKFHDGTDFNADAVIFNFERWRFTTNPYHFASQVFEYYEAQFGGFDDGSIITSIDKVDDYTIKFNLSAPQAPFLANLAMDTFAISSPQAIMDSGENYGTPSVGAVSTGPFKFVEWVEGDHITVAANDDYFEGRSKIDEIVWRVIPDDSARFLALKSGDIDALETATTEDLASAANDPSLVVLKKPLWNTGYLAFNYKVVELQDPKVREAVAHAINRQGIVDVFLGDFGLVAKTFLTPIFLGYDEAMQDWTYDPELSKQLLADAGFPDGLNEVTIAEDIQDAEGNVVFNAGDKMPLRLYYMPVSRFYYPSPKEIGEAMAADLTKAGINVELYLEGDWSTYLGSRREGRLVGLYMLGWGGDNGDPDNFLCYFFCTGTEPIAREGWYQNAALAELLLKAQATVSTDERGQMYMQAEQMLHDDIARLWVDHYYTPYVLTAKVKGFVPQAFGSDVYKDVELVQ